MKQASPEESALITLSDVDSLIATGNFTEAHSLLTVYGSSLDDEDPLIHGLLGQGNAKVAQSLFVEAAFYFSAAVDFLMDSNRGSIIRGSLFHGLGISARHMGEYSLARRYFENALSQFFPVGDQRCIAKTLNCVGILAAESGDYVAAVSNYEEALKWARDTDKEIIATVLTNIGEAYLERGYADLANAHVEQAIEILGELGSNRLLSDAKLMYAMVLIRAGENAMAKQTAKSTMRAWEEIGDIPKVAASLSVLVTLNIIDGDLDEATECLGKLTAIQLLSPESVPVRYITYATKGTLAVEQRDEHVAVPAFQAALIAAEELHNPDIALVCRAHLAGLALSSAISQRNEDTMNQARQAVSELLIETLSSSKTGVYAIALILEGRVRVLQEDAINAETCFRTAQCFTQIKGMTRLSEMADRELKTVGQRKESDLADLRRYADLLVKDYTYPLHLGRWDTFSLRKPPGLNKLMNLARDNRTALAFFVFADGGLELISHRIIGAEPASVDSEDVDEWLSTEGLYFSVLASGVDSYNDGFYGPLPTRNRSHAGFALLHSLPYPSQADHRLKRQSFCMVCGLFPYSNHEGMMCRRDVGGKLTAILERHTTIDEIDVEHTMDEMLDVVRSASPT